MLNIPLLKNKIKLYNLKIKKKKKKSHVKEQNFVKEGRKSIEISRIFYLSK
jgi:hypothetical protein